MASEPNGHGGEAVAVFSSTTSACTSIVPRRPIFFVERLTITELTIYNIGTADSSMSCGGDGPESK